MNKAGIDVSIVIVTMNHLPKLKKLLASIYNDGEKAYSYEVILVDNCSKDGTINFVTDNYPEILLIKNSKVNGFASNNNFGVSHSKGNYIFICNPDLILLEGSLDKLLSYAIKSYEPGIICPQLLNSDYSHQTSVRSFHNLNVLFWRLVSRGNDHSKNKIVNRYLLKNFDKNQIQHVDWAIGAAMIIKREIYNILNGFDENLFLYVEDEDLCLRAWQSGYRVTYYPTSVMIHDHQRQSVKRINKMTWFHFKSLIYFFLKHNLIFRKIDRTKFAKNKIINKGVEVVNEA